MARKGIKTFSDWKKAGGRKGYSKRLDNEFKKAYNSPSSRLKRGAKKAGKGVRRAGRGVRDAVNAPLELAFRSKWKK